MPPNIDPIWEQNPDPRDSRRGSSPALQLEEWLKEMFRSLGQQRRSTTHYSQKPPPAIDAAHEARFSPGKRSTAYWADPDRYRGESGDTKHLGHDPDPLIRFLDTNRGESGGPHSYEQLTDRVFPYPSRDRSEPERYMPGDTDFSRSPIREREPGLGSDHLPTGLVINEAERQYEEPDVVSPRRARHPVGGLRHSLGHRRFPNRPRSGAPPQGPGEISEVGHQDVLREAFAPHAVEHPDWTRTPREQAALEDTEGQQHWDRMIGEERGEYSPEAYGRDSLQDSLSMGLGPSDFRTDDLAPGQVSRLRKFALSRAPRMARADAAIAAYDKIAAEQSLAHKQKLEQLNRLHDRSMATYALRGAEGDPARSRTILNERAKRLGIPGLLSSEERELKHGTRGREYRTPGGGKWIDRSGLAGRMAGLGEVADAYVEEDGQRYRRLNATPGSPGYMSGTIADQGGRVRHVDLGTVGRPGIDETAAEGFRTPWEREKKRKYRHKLAEDHYKDRAEEEGWIGPGKYDRRGNETAESQIERQEGHADYMRWRRQSSRQRAGAAKHYGSLARELGQRGGEYTPLTNADLAEGGYSLEAGNIGNTAPAWISNRDEPADDRLSRLTAGQLRGINNRRRREWIKGRRKRDLIQKRRRRQLIQAGGIPDDMQQPGFAAKPGMLEKNTTKKDDDDDFSPP